MISYSDINNDKRSSILLMGKFTLDNGETLMYLSYISIETRQLAGIVFGTLTYRVHAGQYFL